MKITEDKSSWGQPTPAKAKVTNQEVNLGSDSAIFRTDKDLPAENLKASEKLGPFVIPKVSTADIQTPNIPILSTADIQTPIDPNFDQKKHDFYLSVISSTKIDEITAKL